MGEELDPNTKYYNDRLSLRKGSLVEQAMAETKARTNALTGGSNEGEYVPVDTSSSNQTTKDQISAYSSAASTLKSGQDSNSEGASAVQGGLNGAAAGAAIGGGNPYAIAGGAAIGALSGIMNAKANNEKARIEAEREKATAMAENIRLAGMTQQTAMTNMMNSFNHILAPRKA